MSVKDDDDVDDDDDDEDGRTFGKAQGPGQPVSHTGTEKQRVLAGIKDDG